MVALLPGIAWAQATPGQNLGAARVAPPTGLARNLSERAGDVFNPLDYGALGNGAPTPIGATYGGTLAALAGYATPAGAKPFAWAANPAFGLTFAMTPSATSGTATQTFVEKLGGINNWSATVALWQDPAHGNYLLRPGMLASGPCIAANTTVAAVNRAPAAAGYGTVTLSARPASPCSPGTPITFTIAPAQLQALTADWLGWQAAMAQAWLKPTGGRVHGPSGNYVLNHSLVNPGGITDSNNPTPNLDIGGDGVAVTHLSWPDDLGADFAAIIEATRGAGNVSQSSYHDLRLSGPRLPAIVWGAAFSAMDGLAIGKGALLRNLIITGMRAGVSGVNDHWELHSVFSYGNGCGVRYAPYSPNMGNQLFEDGSLAGNTIGSVCVSTTNQIDSSMIKNVHTGFGPHGFWYEENTPNVASTLGFISNSTFIGVWTEAVGNCWICGHGNTGWVDGNTFISGGGADVGTQPNFALRDAAGAVPPAHAVIAVARFAGNTMIDTTWSGYAALTGAVVVASGECNGNTWQNDPGFVFGARPTVSQLDCDRQADNTFSGPFGSGVIRTVIYSSLAALQPLQEAGYSGVAPFVDGKPFAGLAATAVTAALGGHRTVAVLTSAPSLPGAGIAGAAGVPKADAGQAIRNGTPVFATSSPGVGVAGGLDQTDAIGTAIADSPAGAATVMIALNPGMHGGATGAATGLTAAGTTQATALPLASSVSQLTSVASGAGAILGLVPVGAAETVCNDGADAVKIYPPLGGTIQGFTVNAAAPLAPAACASYRRLSATLWHG